MTHTCPLCNKWVPKMHIKNHIAKHKGYITRYPYALQLAFTKWLVKLSKLENQPIVF
jgi:hypothetical protein